MARKWTWVALLWVSVALAAFAGCSSDEGGASANNGGFGNTAGTGGGSAGTGGSIDIDASTQALSVEPASVTLTITNKTVAVSQQFTAKLGSTNVPAVWTLDNYNLVSIDSNGLAASTGIVAGKIKVTATHAGKKASADLIVNVELQEDVSTNIDPGNKTALGGSPAADPGLTANPPNPTRLLYPYDKTVMPKGVVAPLVMFSPGSVAPESAALKLSGNGFSWQGFYTVTAPATPRLTIPQDIWDAAMASASGATLNAEVVKAAGGTAYGPYAIDITAAPGSLKGVVYYMTYQAPTGLYAARPGNTQPAKQVKSGCVVCHSVSANGKYLSTGAEVSVQSAESGVYEVDLAGNATQISQSPPGLGGDTRGLSFAAWTPDGKYVMRSQNDFWGGVNQMAWKVDATGKKLDQANVVGLGATLSAYLPAFSHDGKFLAFTQGNGESGAPGSAIRSIDVMDVAIDETNGPAGTLTFTNRQVVLDNGATGKVTKYATFLPDSNLIVLQESQSYDPAHGGMLATRNAAGQYGAADGRLNLIDIANKAHVELKNANLGNVPKDEDKNFEPFALPIPAGGYYWVVFTSIREYGNLQQGAATRKQLWVAAITPGKSTADPSHPPFFLPNQTDTKNERGFWALDPCKPKAASCENGDECCDGACRPSDASDPSSPKICGEPEGCAQISEKCTTDADCCAAATGINCLGGFCSPQPPS